MERKLNIKVLLPEEVIEKYDIDEDTGVLSYFEDGAIHILIEDDDEMPEEEMHDTRQSFLQGAWDCDGVRHSACDGRALTWRSARFCSTPKL